LRRRHLAFGGTPESFEAHKAELVAEEQQRQAQQVEDGTTAQARRRVARAI
jgi:ribosomal protein L29